MSSAVVNIICPSITLDDDENIFIVWVPGHSVV